VPTLPPGAVAASAREFADAWNANVAGTDVPRITREQVTELDTGANATTFVAALSDRVGLVAVVREDGAVTEVLLAWIPGGDEEDSARLYRNAFDVLLRTVNPALTAQDRSGIAAQLGVTEGRPPFDPGETLTADVFPQRYTRYVRDTSVSPETAVISVIDARPR
jgi:hypothetical protein